jgi:3-hydroxyacyl-CoA dehydrogenase
MTVFGAGLMGAGIAQVGAQNGLKVCLNDYLTLRSSILESIGKKGLKWFSGHSV